MTKPKTKSAQGELSRRELTDLAVTYAALLGIKIQRWGIGWMALGKADPSEPTFIIGWWHTGPHPSRYKAAIKGLGVLGYRISPSGELNEF